MSSVSSNYSTTNSALARNAQSLADNLSSAESAYVNAAKSGDKGALVQAEMNYQKQQEAFQALMQMLKNRFDTMMQAIRNMALN